MAQPPIEFGVCRYIYFDRSRLIVNLLLLSLGMSPIRFDVLSPLNLTADLNSTEKGSNLSGNQHFFGVILAVTNTSRLSAAYPPVRPMSTRKFMNFEADREKTATEN